MDTPTQSTTIEDLSAGLFKVHKNSPFILNSFDIAGKTAMHYGFVPIKTPTICRKDQAPAKSLSETNPASLSNTGFGGKEQTLGLIPEERCALFRMYREEGIHSLDRPSGLYFELPLQRGLRGKTRERQHGLEIIGTSESVADAILIKTALSILKEEGHPDVEVRINSIGDINSRTRFERELTSYFRKRANDLGPEENRILRENVYALMHMTGPEIDEIKKESPETMEFLDEDSRCHFMSVLEYLETLGIPYNIDSRLVADSYFTHTVFEIRKKSTEPEKLGELLARGGRYMHVAPRTSFREDIPSATVSLSYKRGKRGVAKKFLLNKIDEPKCYFVQLGKEAKLKSLRVIEDLREADVMVHHALAHQKCLGQMDLAKKLNSPYIIIMGQKEALEDTVMVRDTETYSQETIPTPDLVRYLKQVLQRCK